ncbi:MATE family efflux transporter [Anaeromicropila populeti]|uniref:Putative efflux protein, MATE family n=1 Tax=Anaeromicropila populeti TaxID=37658 RepID=A0A1I6JNL3_9FIRM|nr:MATE family efflux transporter [Anaeromicropila populeti]SFR80555.1 putative efflux protein, MATE family [Anaeromicropila populeti]
MEETNDLDKMKTNSYVFKMSLPIFVELLLQLLVGNIDQIMVGHYRKMSVAAIVNGNQIMSIVIIVLNMMSMATTVVLSQFIGARDQEKANQTCTLSVSIITFSSFLATLIIFVFRSKIFAAMNVDAEILGETTGYLLIVASFIIVQGLYLNIAAILRSHTFLKQVMYVSVIMNILNVFGNFVLINGWSFFPQLGVAGAAVSTGISKTIGLSLITILLFRKTKIKFRWMYLKKNPFPIFKKIIMIGLPSGLESLSYQVSQLFILGMINSFGKVMTITKGYCSILANFSYVYAIAIAQATQIIVGYLLGARRIDDLTKRVWDTLKIAFICCVGLSTLLYFNSNLIFRIFTDIPEVFEVGKKLLLIEIFLEFGRAVNIVMTRMLIGVGNVKVPITVGISGHWILACFLSYLFGVVLHWGIQGIWVAMAVDECTRGLIYVITFRRNRWRKNL